MSTTNLREALPKMNGPLPGPKTKELLARREDCMPAAIRSIYPCAIERGEGAMIEDADGNVLLDWVGGVGVMNLGYSHPEIIAAVEEQSKKYFHSMMNITTHEPYLKLAEKMNQIVPVRGDKKRTMLANSGAEAVENAVKIARGYTKRPNIVVFTGAFHGRTLLTMTMTANKKYAVGMGPFPDGIIRADFPNMYRKPDGMTDAQAIDYYYKRLLKVFDDASPSEYVAAIVIEPVQGEGGFVPVPIEWVKAVRKMCDEKGILLVADEVQTGIGRTGRLYASEYWKEAGCAPDIITSAKSIAGGLPLSAVTARAEIIDGVPVATIGGTFCGNPVACMAALKAFEIVERDKLSERALQIADKCTSAIHKMAEKYPVIGDIRGTGSMFGVEFVKDRATKEPNADIVSAMVQGCLQKGLIIEAAGPGNVIRFLCPLVVTDAQLDAGLKIFEEVLAENCK